jgi:hypothetical protein
MGPFIFVFSCVRERPHNLGGSRDEPVLVIKRAQKCLVLLYAGHPGRKWTNTARLHHMPQELQWLLAKNAFFDIDNEAIFDQLREDCMPTAWVAAGMKRQYTVCGSSVD